MLRENLKQLEAVYSELNNRREKTKVELKSAPRITLFEKAEDPLMPSNGMFRAMLTALAMLAAFCCPAAVVILWDAHTRRINTADDVSQGLRLPVIGSVPLIPSRVIRQLGSPSKRYQSWHVRLTESVDGITARVLHKAELGQCRVIMVSSATGGEGKTTLATQLAMSLARTERRIVLVDFDLRRPAFDELFGVPLEPGVCDVLRQQNTVSELVHPSGTENLDVITAGRWDRHTLASLSNGCAAAMFQQLRDAYEFVVIDTSPLLPVADARFVSQHVDAVVLSVLRDISEAPKIQAACDILAAFGVHVGGGRGHRRQLQPVRPARRLRINASRLRMNNVYAEQYCGSPVSCRRDGAGHRTGSPAGAGRPGTAGGGNARLDLQRHAASVGPVARPADGNGSQDHRGHRGRARTITSRLYQDGSGHTISLHTRDVRRSAGRRVSHPDQLLPCQRMARYERDSRGPGGLRTT